MVRKTLHQRRRESFPFCFVVFFSFFFFSFFFFSFFFFFLFFFFFFPFFFCFVFSPFFLFFPLFSPRNSKKLCPLCVSNQMRAFFFLPVRPKIVLLYFFAPFFLFFSPPLFFFAMMLSWYCDLLFERREISASLLFFFPLFPALDFRLSSPSFPP